MRSFLSWQLLAVMLAIAAPARAEIDQTVRYKVKDNDTLELIAAEYYGDRRHAIFIMVANDMTHPRKLKRGERLNIPVSTDLTTAVGDTFEGLAKTHLGDERRAEFLARFNNVPADETLAAGQTLRIPFHVTHTAAGRETLAEIAAAYFADKRQAELLQQYNFRDSNVLEKSESIVVPIHHVSVRASRLPPPDAESRARVQKRLEMQDRAESVLPDARRAWRDGDFAAVKRALTTIDPDYLDNRAGGSGRRAARRHLCRLWR